MSKLNLVSNYSSSDGLNLKDEKIIQPSILQKDYSTLDRCEQYGVGQIQMLEDLKGSISEDLNSSSAFLK